MLPEGLEPGTLVEVIHFDSGYYMVEDSSGQRWRLFMVNLAPVFGPAQRVPQPC